MIENSILLRYNFSIEEKYYETKKIFAAMLAAAVVFAACGSLQYIMFPKTVTTVGTKLVTDFTSLLAVRYTGTEDEWNASDFKTQEFSELPA